MVLNKVAQSVIESLRGKHPQFVFVRESKSKSPQPVAKMYNTAWKAARERAADRWTETLGEEAPEGFRRVRVHDLKHTFGRRLRAAGVSFEDRQDLLGHKSGRITTHYSQAELSNLIEAAERVENSESRKTPETTWLRRKPVRSLLEYPHLMARPERFELPTSWFVAMRSIQLSYGRVMRFSVRPVRAFGPKFPL